MSGSAPPLRPPARKRVAEPDAEPATGFPVDDDRMIQRATLAGPQPTGRNYEG